MAISLPQLDRLKAQLLTSGLQGKNQPLYQVINQLIDALRQGVNELDSQITSIINTVTPSSADTIITNGGFGMRDGEDGIDGMDGMIGPIGPRGPQGLQGPPGMDCECEDWSMPFVGNSVMDATLGGAYVQRTP